MVTPAGNADASERTDASEGAEGDPGARHDIRGRVLVPGRGEGPLLRLTRPISFWGGVDPVAGVVMDPRHPQHGTAIAGTVLLVPEAVGSSSSSAIMLELLRERTAPAAILMGRADAILALGAVVGRELGYAPVPIVEVDAARLEGIDDGRVLWVDAPPPVEGEAKEPARISLAPPSAPNR